MSEFPNRFVSPEDAYFGFFRADNAQNPAAWADVMSYPHVRVSARAAPAYYETPTDYAAQANWEGRMATGWVRSQGIEPTIAFETADKVHLLGGWTRFNASDEPILHNRVTYILTHIDGSWGIQARFGVDSFRGHDEPETVSDAVQTMNQFVEHIAASELIQASALCRKPLVDVRVGQVDLLHDDTLIQTFLGDTYRACKPAANDTHSLQTGIYGAVLATTMGFVDKPDQTIVSILGKQDGKWQICGLSSVES